jgi:hypothetical protein
MKKIFIISFFTLATCCSKSQLQISAGINWKSSPGTYVVLDKMNLQHDATSASLDNVFKFTGNTNISISGATLPLFSNVQVALNGSSKIILQRTINVSQTITFQSGLLDLNNNNIDLGTTGTLNGESETSRLIASNGGFIQVMNTLNAPSSVNPGNLGAIITSVKNMGSTIIRRGHLSQSKSGLSNFSINRYYDISPANNSSLNATLQFNYFNAELGGMQETNLWLWKSNDLTNWFVSPSTDSRDSIVNYVSGKGIQNFSRWTLSGAYFPQSLYGPCNDKIVLKVWPNPFIIDFNIGINSDKNGTSFLHLYDISGKLVSTRSIALRSGSNLYSFSFPDLPIGSYVVKIADAGCSTTVGEIIKMSQ